MSINAHAIQNYFALLRIFIFNIGLMTWKALSPRGEICLVVDLGEKKLVKSNRKGEGLLWQWQGEI